MENKGVIYAVYSRATGCRDAFMNWSYNEKQALDSATELNKISKWRGIEHYYVRATDDLRDIPGYMEFFDL